MTISSEARNPLKIIPTFGGKKEIFHRFMLKFRAYGNERGFKNVLTSSTNKPADPGEASLSEEEMKWVKANEKAIGAYTMALVGTEVFEVICNSVEGNYLDGLVYKITEILVIEYQPSDGTASLEYLNQLYRLKLEKEVNPTKTFNYSVTANSVQERDLVMAIIRAAHSS